MLSREYFDQVRNSVADLRRAEETVDYWESRINSIGGGLSSGPSHGSDPDRLTGRLAALWDAREQAERQAEGLVALQDEAILVIRLVGDQAAAATSLWRDVLQDRFVMSMDLTAIAEKRSRSVSAVRRAISDACAWVDDGPGIDALIGQARQS